MGYFLGTEIRRTLSGVECETERYLARPSSNSYVWIYRHEKSMSVGAGSVTGERVYAKALYYGPSSMPPLQSGLKHANVAIRCKLSQMAKYATWILGNNLRADSCHGLWNNVYISLILKGIINCVDFTEMREKDRRILFFTSILCHCI